MHSRMHASRDEHAGMPARPWVAHALLLALMLLNHMDRQLVVALFPQLAGLWALRDAQLALLTSIVLTLVALFTVPMALLGDRWGRALTVATMAAVWSLACAGLTVACTVGPAAAMLFQLVSEAWRGTAAALLPIAQNLMGLAAGPMLAGWLSALLGLAGTLQVLSHAAVLAAVALVAAGLLCREGSDGASGQEAGSA